MTVLYTIWLVVSGLIWLFLLFMARKKIRDHIFNPQVESMDDLGDYVQKVIHAGFGFPMIAITWPLWVPVICLMLGISFLWDDYLKPYLDKILFHPKKAIINSGGGSIYLQGGSTGTGGPVSLEGTTYDNRTPEEKGKQTISTGADLGSKITLTGGDGGLNTTGSVLNEVLNEVEKREPEKKDPEPEEDELEGDELPEIDAPPTTKEESPEKK